jgi:hypothetical protein
MRGALAAALLLVACGAEEATPIAAGDERAFPGATGTVEQGVYLAPGGPLHLTYERLQGHAVAEGDILLSDNLLAAPGADEKALTAVASASRLWPGGVIPYRVRDDVADPGRITDAMEAWESATPIRFVPRTDEADFVEFCPGQGCSSHVGRVGGEQPLYLAEGCVTGSVIHEIGHLVGLWHEQSRPDRDHYVEVLWDNVEPGHEFNFDRLDDDDARPVGPYDLRSIMHYGPFIFSRNGAPTLVRRDDGLPVPGHRLALSDDDIRGVRLLYHAR